MYEWLKSIVFPLLRISDTQPHPPAGYDPHESMQVMRATPNYLRYRLLYWKAYAFVWGASILALATVLLVVGKVWLWLVVPIIIVGTIKAAILYVTTRMDYEMRWYILTDRSLLIREGVWNIRETTLTFANAQNVHVIQGPLQRYFGFANVQVDTAGGGSGKAEQGVQSHRAVLRGIDNAGEVRDQILQLLRSQKSSGLGDPDDGRDRGHGGQVKSLGLNPVILQEVWEEARLLHARLRER